ncbi:hypothetical protein, partial [Candidatus Marithrix sp. Canyon 246]|uniref:hypothetical protein n=1 Tax=Candidatus Marithrix sp. Canyon 246 TaxID=1827136 RepID=UPI001C0D77DD
FSVLGCNVLAGDTFSSQAIYDSKTKTLSLEGILVPFIDDFTGKETDNKGIFDAQLQEKTKLVFELIPWSINFKDKFNGDDTSGYILYDYKTRSVNIPCFEVTTIAKLGDGIEGEKIYYKDVSMKQRHVAYPIFHVEDMTKTDSCESSVEATEKPTLTTTPTTTIDDTVEVEVNGKVGTTVFVNGVDSGKTIDSTGKVKVVLDTSGDDGDKSFAIKLVNIAGVESDELNVTILKNSILPQYKIQLQTSETNFKGPIGHAEFNITIEEYQSGSNTGPVNITFVKNNIDTYDFQKVKSNVWDINIFNDTIYIFTYIDNNGSFKPNSKETITFDVTYNFHNASKGESSRSAALQAGSGSKESPLESDFVQISYNNL